MPCSRCWTDGVGQHWSSRGLMMEPIGDQGHISQTHFELITEILQKFSFFRSWSDWSYQAPMLHMSRQLGCRDMCKIGNWSTDNFSNKSNIILFSRFGLWADKPFIKWVPGACPITYQNITHGQCWPVQLHTKDFGPSTQIWWKEPFGGVFF